MSEFRPGNTTTLVLEVGVAPWYRLEENPKGVTGQSNRAIEPMLDLNLGLSWRLADNWLIWNELRGFRSRFRFSGGGSSRLDPPPGTVEIREEEVLFALSVSRVF